MSELLGLILSVVCLAFGVVSAFAGKFDQAAYCVALAIYWKL